jgi:DNA-binding transcriptional LysR family regulator
LDFAWMTTFVAVARTGSMTAAAAELGISQPGVSRQIQRLEEEIGIPLVDRGSRMLLLTPAGERFRAYADTALAQHEAALRDVRGEVAVLVGELRIGASSTPGEFLVPGLVAAFVDRHPGVRPEVFIADSAIVQDEVRAHRWDIGFVGARLNGRGLDHHPVAQDEVVLAVPAGHPFAARGAVSLNELAGQPFLVREEGSGTAASVERALVQRGMHLPEHRTVMVLGSTQAIVSAVEQGLGLGWVSSLALIDRSRERVVPVRLAALPLRRFLFLVRDPRRVLPPAASAFVAWVLSQLSAPSLEA